MKLSCTFLALAFSAMAVHASVPPSVDQADVEVSKRDQDRMIYSKRGLVTSSGTAETLVRRDDFDWYCAQPEYHCLTLLVNGKVPDQAALSNIKAVNHIANDGLHRYVYSYGNLGTLTVNDKPNVIEFAFYHTRENYYYNHADVNQIAYDIGQNFTCYLDKAASAGNSWVNNEKKDENWHTENHIVGTNLVCDFESKKKTSE